MSAVNAAQSHKRPLKVGLLLPQWTGSLDGDTPRWRDTVEVALLAEQAGFDSLWVSDVLLVKFQEGEPLGIWEGWSWLSAVAAITSRVEIGTLVVSNTFRNPALLAKMADTVDEISGGRLILGIGAGGNDNEHEAFGLPWPRRFDRLEEGLTIIRDLLRNNYSNFNGEFYRLVDCELLPRGPRPQGPPIMVGSNGLGPRMFRIMARYADMSNIWLAFEDCAPSALPPLTASLNEACAKEGRDPATLERTVTVGVAVGDHRLEFGPWDITEAALSGSPEEIAAYLRAFADQGVAHVQVYLAPSTISGVEWFARVLELLDE
jgi:alkanesulfonate monooxygenase SsuD/methylene tetrahydromethanopterin reductase-like flavin-dependent oxidoreductase (luciferase family)